MVFLPAGRIARFIDVANLSETAKALGFDNGYRRLLTMFATKGRLVQSLLLHCSRSRNTRRWAPSWTGWTITASRC